MTLYSPGKIATNSNAVVANVWNWDDKWKVEWMEDGVDKGNMEQIRCQDPIVLANYPVNMHVYSDHFFAAVPTAGTKEITIKATDRFGNVYREKIQLA